MDICVGAILLWCALSVIAGLIFGKVLKERSR